MEDYTAEGWFIPNGKRFTAEQLQEFKTLILERGELVTETLYWKDKNDQVRVLKAGEYFDRQGRIVVVLREPSGMLQAVCEEALDSSNMVAPHDLISPAHYQLRRAMTRGGRD